MVRSARRMVRRLVRGSSMAFSCCFLGSAGFGSFSALGSSLGFLAADAFYGITEIIYINNKSEAYR